MRNQQQDQLWIFGATEVHKFIPGESDLRQSINEPLLEVNKWLTEYRNSKNSTESKKKKNTKHKPIETTN